MTPNILGYHSNSEEKLKTFLEKKELVLYEDSNYLGTGMYFWDNKSNARWWAKKKLRWDLKLKEVLVSQANISLESPILDMTDHDTIVMVRHLWLKYCKKTNEKELCQPMGVILDALFASANEVFKVIKVAKGHGDYSSWEKRGWFKYLGENVNLDNRPKTMYTVRCSSRVDCQELLETVPRN